MPLSRLSKWPVCSWSPPQDLPRTGPIPGASLVPLCDEPPCPSANGSFLPPWCLWCLAGCPIESFPASLVPPRLSKWFVPTSLVPPRCLAGCPFLPPWCLCPGCPGAKPPWFGSFLPPWCLPGWCLAPRLSVPMVPPRCLAGCPMDPVLPPWCLLGCPNGPFLPPWCLPVKGDSLPGASQAVQMALSCLPGASQAVQLILSCLPGASQAVQLVLSCLPGASLVPPSQMVISCLPGASQAVQMVLSCLPGASLSKAILCYEGQSGRSEPGLTVKGSSFTASLVPTSSALL